MRYDTVGYGTAPHGTVRYHRHHHHHHRLAADHILYTMPAPNGPQTLTRITQPSIHIRAEPLTIRQVNPSTF